MIRRDAFAHATLIAALAATALTGCPQTQSSPSYPENSSITLASSPRCAGGSCSCRPLDSNDGQQESEIPAGQKRFEFRLPRTTSALWVEVGGRGVYFKAQDQVAPTCFYVDLPPGEHPVVLQAEARDPEVGLQAGLSISEYGAKEGPNWYRSVKVVCGQLGRCSRNELNDWAAAQRKLPRGVLDACGSVMVRGVSFGGRRDHYRDGEYVELTVKLMMKVYDFETYRAPGSPECKAPIKNR